MAGGPFAELDHWRLARRYAVPGWMIAECTAARERADWRAACAAARVTVAFGEPGPEAAELLAGFAPDLLRWHLPRSRGGSATLAAGLRYVLAPDGPVGADTVVLEIRSPDWSTGSQRLTLHAGRAGDLAEGLVVPLPPHFWDARRAGELRAEPEIHGLGAVEAWNAAGWTVDEAVIDSWGLPGMEMLRPADPRFAAREVRRLAAQFGRESWALRTVQFQRASGWRDWHLRLEVAGDRLRVTRDTTGARAPGAEPCLHPELLRGPVDAELVRHGRIDAAQLHPLVRDALFPGAADGLARPLLPGGFAGEERVRVRCGRDWHWIALRAGHLELLHPHTDDERRREATMRALGGAVGGCIEAERIWHGGAGNMPRRLREYRAELWRRMEHGGGRVVLALLDAGLDPHLRDARGRTLLHRIHQFEHPELLPRLLAAGLDVNARSRRGYTPMCEALVNSASAEVLAALHEAGAFPPLSRPDQVRLAAHP
ncbi:hypothetical protein [Dactylosporangium sp. NPDC049140]|uniref:hypothetical protein n=1 Tax=Dactylosporangium sp. NPDC049140 TaxID=3155647 RepID=UPI0033C18B67